MSRSTRLATLLAPPKESPRRRRHRPGERSLIALVMLAACTIGCSSYPEPVVGLPDPEPGGPVFAALGDLELHFIDVGQGDSTLVICPNGRRILIDVGSKGGLDAAGRTRVKNYLRDNILDGPSGGLDVLIVSHPDGDHYNLIARSLAGVPIGKVIFGGSRSGYNAAFRNWLGAFESSDRLIQPDVAHFDPPDDPSEHLECGVAEVWMLAANVEATQPASNFVKNSRSVVLKVTFGEFDAILTADGTTDTEAAIEAAYPPDFLAAEVLKLGHHGSRATSTSRRWAGLVAPAVAIASASGSNRFGHPARDVIDRVVRFTDDLDDTHRLIACANPRCCDPLQVDERVYSTATSGTLVVTSDGDGWNLTCSRSGGC